MISSFMFLSRLLCRPLRLLGATILLLGAFSSVDARAIDLLTGNNSIAPGTEVKRTFVWPKDGREQRCIVELQARIQATGIAVGWCNQVLTVTLNGKEVASTRADGTPRLMNKPSAIDARSLTIREKYPNNWWQPGGWALFYSESFQTGSNAYRPDGPQPLESEYLPATGDPYLFDLDVSDLVTPGSTNEIVLRYNRFNGKLLSEITSTPATLMLGRLEVRSEGQGITDRGASPKNPNVYITGGQDRLEQAIRENSIRYEIKVNKDGSITFFQKKNVLGRLSSAFSFPGGGFHYFGPPFKDGEATGDWRVEIKDRGYYITIYGLSPQYRITRTIVTYKNRLEISDSFENRTDEVLGIMMDHRLEGFDSSSAVYVGGQAGAVEEVSNYKAWSNPTLLFLSQHGGIGMVSVDDVLRVQGSLYHRGSSMGLADQHFGLAPRAKYTTHFSVYMFPEWAGYYDFINEVRKDWKVNYPVAGSSAFFCPNDYVPKNNVNKMDETQVARWLGNRNANVAMTYAPTDVYTNGATRFIGYSTVMLQFPEYKPMFREAAAKIRKANPNAKILVYMHTGICGLPDGPKKYADTMVTRADGSHFAEPYYDHYYDAEHKRAGWHTWYYYLKLGTPFYQDIEKVVDYYLNDLGADGIYWDELSVQSWATTYNEWDGHTVNVDAKTKLVAQKYGDLRLLSLPANEALLRHIQKKGGMVVANSNPATKTITDKHLIHFTETGNGAGNEMPLVHLTTPVTLGAGPVLDHGGVIADIRHCLMGGCLYYYYNGQPDCPTITSRMFPFTSEYIGRGFLIGKERIITAVSGTFSWKEGGKEVKVYDYAPDGRLTSDSPRTMRLKRSGQVGAVVEKNHVLVIEPGRK
jgi:hypothetical protein